MKIVRRIILGAVALIVLAIVAVTAYRAVIQHRIANRTEITSPSGINEAKYIDVNGAQEWITIRGQNRSNPVILFLHGGPAEANSPFAELYLPFEKDYIFVQWDQPGAGMTYIKAGDHQPALSLDGTATDGIAVAEYVEKELHQTKIILIGQDWGGLVGIRMIEKRPELFTAFVGTGQIVGMAATQQVLYQYALSHATANHDEKMLAALKQVGPAPYPTLEQYGQFEDCCRNPFWPADDVAAINRLRALLVFSPSLSIGEAHGWYEALRTDEVKLDEVVNKMADLRETDTKFSVPVFFIQGENDNVTPTSLVSDYASKIQAPEKNCSVVPGAGHFVMWTHPKEFLKDLNQDLRASPTSAAIARE